MYKIFHNKQTVIQRMLPSEKFSPLWNTRDTFSKIQVLADHTQEQL